MGESFEDIRQRAGLGSRRLVFAHPDDARVIIAAAEIRKAGLARPTLLGEPEQLLECGRRNGVDLSGIEMRSPASAPLGRYAEALLPEWRAKGLRETEVRHLLEDPLWFSVAMVRCGEADGVLAGRGRVTRSIFAGGRPFRYFVAELASAGQPRCVLLASTFQGARASALDLAETALGAADLFRRLMNREPSLAYLSLGVPATLEAPQRFKSARQVLSERVRDAVATVRARQGSLELSGDLVELPGTGELADLCVLASGGSGSAHSLGQLLPGVVRVLGPLFGGVDPPVNELCSSVVEDIVDVGAITCLG